MATPTTQQILNKIEELEDYLNKLDMIPASCRYRNAVILALLSKALTVGRAICVLVDGGFPAEAFAMSRTLIEIYFCVRYISNKDTEARAATYANYHARVRQEWQTIIMKYYPNRSPAEIRLDADILEKAKEFKSKAHWTGHGGQAKMMALEEDPLEDDLQGQPEKSEFDYDALYFWTSHFVHATVVAAEAHATEPGEVFRVHARSWIDKKRAGDALFNIAVFLNKLFVRACRAMNEEQPDVLQDLYKMISDFARA
ncbi:MAG: DUF5677 domain-containing protein [Candidatus Acidiferrales bacterium]